MAGRTRVILVPDITLGSIVTLLLILLGFSVLWFTLPMFHSLWFEIIILHPIGILLCFAALAFTLFVAASMANAGADEFATVFIPVMILFGCASLLFVYGSFSLGLASNKLVNSTPVQTIEKLPSTTEIRFLPLEIAKRYGANRFQEPTLRLGDLDPLDLDQELVWIAPRVPNGFINSAFKQSDGFVIVRSDGKVDVYPQPQKYGEGMMLTDEILWPLLRQRYFVTPAEVYYVKNGDHFLTVVPYISYRFEFPVWIPYWGGVFVVHKDGKIEDLTPKEAQSDPRFENQRLYPELLARWVAEAWAYKHGILNRWFIHQDQTEIPHIADSQNQMPYLLPTDKGPVWFIAAEPSGPSASIFKMFFIDAHTGDLSLYELPQDASLIGPNRSLDYVRSAYPTFNWYKKGDKESSGNITVIEPRPVVYNNVLYWMTTVTTTDYSGISRTTLVSSIDGSVLEFTTKLELEDFLRGKSAARHVGSQTLAPAAGSLVRKLTDYSTQELLTLLRQVVDELERRGK